MTTEPTYYHPVPGEVPGWTQGAGDGWLLLKGPSNECWFAPWVQYLEEKQVKVFWNKTLTSLHFDGAAITSATCGDEIIRGDIYILAINPFITAEILDKTPALEKQKGLNLFKPLTRGGPHTQVSFRLAFAEKIHFPRPRTAVVVSDSEFNITLFAQEQAWDGKVDLGRDIQSLWTATSFISSVPGRIYHKPVNRCTKEEFIDEVRAQIFNCGTLDTMVQEANNGKKLQDFSLVDIEVWHEWQFSREGIQPAQPKWVNNTNNQAYMPPQKTGVVNLYLAGAHTRMQAHVWSIEGAVESGRRAPQKQ